MAQLQIRTHPSPLTEGGRRILPLRLAGALLLTLLPGAALAAEGGAAGGDPGETATGATQAAPMAERAVTVHFEATFGDQPFQCGLSYDGVGVAASTVTPRDLRIYVSEVEFLRADGSVVPMRLEQDGLWQHQSVVLLDFEDGTEDCRNGNSKTRKVITGTIPEGSVEGIRFTLGVPVEFNHINQATAPSPLSLTSMFWSWNAGYKFFRTEIGAEGLPQGYHFHLGSMYCMPEGRATQPATECRAPNRAQVTLESFEVDQDRIVMDLAELFRGTDFSEAGAATPRCMAVPGQMACDAPFAALGLPFGEREAATQSVFRVESLR